MLVNDGDGDSPDGDGDVDSLDDVTRVGPEACQHYMILPILAQPVEGSLCPIYVGLIGSVCCHQR